jgi:hypothetical protein
LFQEEVVNQRRGHVLAGHADSICLHTCLNQYVVTGLTR